jgi:polysaccharide biosynthesis transport protein
LNQSPGPLRPEDNSVVTVPLENADVLAFAEAEESVFRRYWRILLKRRWIIAAAVLVAVLLAVAVAVLSQRMYSATVRLEIAREGAEVIDLEKDTPRSPAADQEFYQTQYALLKSRSLAEAVAKDLRLANNDEFLLGYEGGDPSELPSERAQREAMATQMVMEETQVIPVRLSSVVDLEFRSPDPAMAAAVANSLAENYIQFNLEKRFEANAYAREFLENQLAQARQRLEASERQSTAYAGRNEIINIAPTVSGVDADAAGQQSLTVASLAAANDALSEARTARIAAESAYRQSQRSGAPTETLQNPAVNTLRQQRATLSAELQRLQSDFGPEYPQVAAIKAQVSELDRQISQETSRVSTTVSGDLERRYRQALATERELAGRVAQLKGAAIDLRGRSIQYNIFERDVDTNRALYDALLQRYREVGVAGGIGSNNVTIVDRALPPGQPYSPNVRLNILLGLLLGLVLGSLAALLLEQLEDAAILPEDFQSKLGVPLLGSVPAMDKAESVEDMLEDPKSPMSEAYFSVLTGLQFSTTHGMPKSLTVTSTQPSEGKSTTAQALARSLAKIGKRVLLIDADLRNPSVHKEFGLANERGLANVLIGDGTIEQHAQQSALPNLFVLTSGLLPPNPSELLAGDSLEPAISRATAAFDHVIVDAPPVLGLADSPLLSRVTEATVFVLEAGRTRAAQARTALRRLLQVDAPVVGAVLTKLDSKRVGYGYGYGYDYNYSSGRKNSGGLMAKLVSGNR